MLYGRDARLLLGVESEEVVAKPTHGPAKYLEDLRKRQNALQKLLLRESSSPRRNRNILMIREIERNGVKALPLGIRCFYRTLELED